ncbi:MAG: OmpA family protein [Myxococcaceae bacterium]
MSKLSIALLALALPFAAQAQDSEVPTDLEGSHDHPGVKRYPGSLITEFNQKEFEEFKFPTADDDDTGEVKIKVVEGKYLSASYSFPLKASCTQVIRNFENAHKAAGLKLHSGKQAPLEVGWGESRWISAEGQVKGRGGTLYVLHTCHEYNDATVANHGELVVVEAGAMAQKVEITADYLVDEMEKSGRVALYGINFATGKAEITPDSAKTLAEIAKLLGQKPEWKIRVEGHTDNVGKAKANLELSKKRAAAVKDWLVKTHKVGAARLTTDGLGDSKPLEPNTSEDGRAKNRRVELVKT